MQATVCADIGNYSTLISTVTGRTASPVLKMRSLLYNCTHNGEVRDNVHTAENPLVYVNHKYWKVGRQAGLYKDHINLAEAGKNRCDLVLPLLLAGTPSGFEGEVKFLVPKRDSGAEKLLKTSIIGTHEYSVNGKEAIANFTDVAFTEETKAPAKFAFEAGVVAPNDVILLIDLGGGTCNCGVFAYEDDVFSTRFYKSYDNSGGIGLAQAICNTDLVKSYKRTVDISKIMDALTDGKTHIGNNPDYSFASVLDDCIDTWFDSLLTKVLSSTQQHLDEVTQILWCGGGSELIKNRLIQQGQTVLDNPQYANIDALIHFSKTPNLAIAA
ncbi:hypothetical protein F7734_51925 [Scytonema sp. UIC 10036]|uniref:plasmid segregation protein ParM domain-containing protein n=1 Tax=Scytonema sp. UIC 10036 TaxID=2304196 RepID=UPI0012DA76D8|nr:plasmid segregation protein ParM domain-containing protein [Scytonema sp. UIC 10036]MUH00335.1 hypothetical protein [Scytonema sp. UIC 10036]